MGEGRQRERKIDRWRETEGENDRWAEGEMKRKGGREREGEGENLQREPEVNHAVLQKKIRSLLCLYATDRYKICTMVARPRHGSTPSALQQSSPRPVEMQASLTRTLILFPTLFRFPALRLSSLVWNPQGGVLSPEARCAHLAGVLETASAALFDERRQVVNTLVSIARCIRNELRKYDCTKYTSTVPSNDFGRWGVRLQE